MADTAGVHIVFGASGGAGNALVRELASRGNRVRAVSHSGRGSFPEEVEVVRGDALDPAGVRELTEGAEVVYHCVNVPYAEWPEKLPRIMDNVIAGAAAQEARLVYADNLYMYGPVAGPMTEDLRPHPNTRKGALRAELADRLLQAHQEGRVQAVIARASDFYGLGPLNAIGGERLFQPVLKGKRAMWVGNLDVPHSLTYIEDFARMLATLGEREEALGAVWHAPAAEPLTGRQFLTMVFEEADEAPRIGSYTRASIWLAGLFSWQMREFLEMLYQFEQPFVLDGTKYTGTFGDEATPHREAIRRTLRWYRERVA